MRFEIANDNTISLVIVFGLFHSPACYEICRLIILMGVTRGEEKVAASPGNAWDCGRAE